MKQSIALFSALTQRDIAIISMVDGYGGCTIDQLRRRFFPTSGARSACYARIARLVAAGYLTSVRLPAFIGTGSGKALLTVGRAARSLLAKQFTAITGSAPRHASAVVSPFVHHHLAIGDFRLTLELACQVSGTHTLVEWTSEQALRRSPLRVLDPDTGTMVPLIPDGTFCLSRVDGARQPFLLELDMGTLSSKRLRAKLRLYAILARDCRSIVSPVLFVVPDTARCRFLATWAEQEAQQLGVDSTVFWVTTQDQLQEHSVLSSPIWQVAGGPLAWSLSGSASPLSKAASPTSETITDSTSALGGAISAPGSVCGVSGGGLL